MIEYETSREVRGYERLRELYPDTRIVCFSSVSAAHGNMGQANYGFANEGMELLARGNNTLCIQSPGSARAAGC